VPRSQSFEEALSEWEEEFKRKRENKGEIPGVTTGIRELDLRTGGLPIGLITVVAARTGMGKSTFARHCLLAAVRKGVGSHIFSLEDNVGMFFDRMLSTLTKIDMEKIEWAWKCSTDELLELKSCKQHLRKLCSDRLRFSWADHRWTSDEVEREVKAHQNDLKTQLVVVDYLHHIYGVNDDHKGVAGILRSMQHSAKRLNAAYLVTSQITRGPEGKDVKDRRPKKHQMRDGGEEQAKLILLLYRPGEYREEPHDTLEINVAKNNKGKNNFTVISGWDGATNTISNFDKGMGPLVRGSNGRDKTRGPVAPPRQLPLARPF